MGDVIKQGCTLKCSFDGSLSHPPAKEEMISWLQHRSGLSEENFEKILQIKYNPKEGVSVLFDDTVNCFVAIRQMTNRTVYGRRGKYKLDISCPRGSFAVLILVPDDVKVLPGKAVIKAMKDYGEIIEMYRGHWRETRPNAMRVPSGDVCLRFLVKNKIPDRLVIDGTRTRLDKLSCGLDYEDRVLQELWDNCRTNKSSSSKEFDMKDARTPPGCTVTLKLTSGPNYRATPRDVYEWLTRDSGLSEKYLRRILVFKQITTTSDSNNGQSYCILFDAAVNCLLAMQELLATEQRSVCHYLNVGNRVEVCCQRGRFADVTLLTKAEGKVLARQKVEEALKPYGKVLDFRRLSQGAQFDSDGTLTFDVRCKMFLKAELPEEIEINFVRVDVIVTERDAEDHDVALLERLWKLTM